jgi:hypothetical protein
VTPDTGQIDRLRRSNQQKLCFSAVSWRVKATAPHGITLTNGKIMK